MAGAVRVTAKFADLHEVRRDLESVRLGLGRELTAAMREVSPIVARGAARLTPRGPGPQGGKDTLPHIADTITGGTTVNALTVESTHPGSRVLEFGGTIAPKGEPITFRAHEMAQRSAQANLPRVEAEMERRIDALLRAHGL